MQIFYVTFCWNKRLFYDGYIIRKDNSDILGYTDDLLIIGNQKGFGEVQRNGSVKFYSISNEIFVQCEAKDGIRVELKGDEEEAKISLKRVQNVHNEEIISKIKKMLKDYPKEIREIVEEMYWWEE